MARTDMFMSYLHCSIIRNVTLVYWTPVCQCDGFVFACGTGAGFEAARVARATGGCWVVYDSVNNQWIQFKHVIDAQALSVWWCFRHWRYRRFSIMKISSAASGASFASRWLQLRPGEQLLSLRWDYTYWQLNSYPILLWYRWEFFVCIFHWYFTMSNIFIINITLSSEFSIYMFMSVWRICRRLWHCGLSLWQPARRRRLRDRYYDDVNLSV